MELFRNTTPTHTKIIFTKKCAPRVSRFLSIICTIYSTRGLRSVHRYSRGGAVRNFNICTFQSSPVREPFLAARPSPYRVPRMPRVYVSSFICTAANMTRHDVRGPRTGRPPLLGSDTCSCTRTTTAGGRPTERSQHDARY